MSDESNQQVEPESDDQVFGLTLAAKDDAKTVQRVSGLLAASHLRILQIDRNDYARTGMLGLGFASAAERDMAVKVLKRGGLDAAVSTGQEKA
jgi:hypothetical protein